MAKKTTQTVTVLKDAARLLIDKVRAQKRNSPEVVAAADALDTLLARAPGRQFEHKHLVERVQSLRAEGMTLKKIADECKINPKTVSRYLGFNQG